MACGGPLSYTGAMLTAATILNDPIGAYPAATVACFDPTTGDLPRRQLDAPRTREFLERLEAAGADALLIGASTGQGHLRTAEELETWLSIADKAALKQATLIALLRPEDGQAVNEHLLDVLVTLGYPVVFFRPGTDLPPDASDAAVVDSLRPLVEAAAQRQLAVGLYSIPDVSGVRLSADAAAQLVQGPGGENIVAAKITEANYERSTLEYLRHPALQRLKIVQGWDPFIARALEDGPRHDSQGRQRCGITSGPMSFAVYQYAHLLAAARRGLWSEVTTALEAVTVLFQAMQDDPGKFADLQRAKYLMGLGHPITSEVSREAVERVLEALRALPRAEDRRRLARSLDLMGDGPHHLELQAIHS